MNAKIRKDILVIENDPKTGDFIKKILENAGYNFSQAFEHQGATEIIEKGAPHLILLDHKLDAQNGHKIIKFLKDSNIYSKIPLVVMTSSKNKKAVLGALSSGAQELVHKPITPQTLLQKLKKVLKSTELPELILSEPKPVEATFLGEIIKINELGLLLQSSIKFTGSTEISIKSEFLKRLGADHCQTTTNNEAKVANPGVYRNEVLLRGMDEQTAQNIRKQKKT